MDPYAPPSTYQIDSSIMRPANLPPLSMQTIGSSDRAFRGSAGGPPPSYGGTGPDRHAPRRGGYRGGAPRGRPPPAGRGGREFPDRGGNGWASGNDHGYHDNAPFPQGGYNRNGYQGDYGHAPAYSFGQGDYTGGQGNSYGRDSGFAPSSRNEFDGELCSFLFVWELAFGKRRMTSRERESERRMRVRDDYLARRMSAGSSSTCRENKVASSGRPEMQFRLAYPQLFDE